MDSSTLVGAPGASGEDTALVTSYLPEWRDRQLADAQQIAQLGSWEWLVRDDRMFWSDELYRILGYDPAALAPSFAAFLGSIHPDDRCFVQRRVEDALITPSCLEFEYRAVRPDGSLRAVHCRAEVLAEECGKPLRMIGTAHDVTELRRFATALSAQVEQLQQLTHASVAIYAAEGREEILEVATGYALRIVGARGGRGSIADPRSPDRPLVYGVGEVGGTTDGGALLASCEPLDHPIRLAVGDVERHAVLHTLPPAIRACAQRGWMAVPLVDPFGGVSGAIQLFEKSVGDFTEGDEALLVQIAQMASLALQKARLFDDLLVSEERYRRLFDAHLSGDFVATVDGEFQEVNLALARILGFDSPDALKAVRLADVFRDCGEHGRLVERLRREGRPIQCETEFVRSDGTRAAAIMNIVGLPGRSGELSALQGCVFDVTEWKRAEAALRESQQQLFQAQKMEAVGQLAGGIAHDFNNMLMAIRGFTDLLEEEVSGSRTAAAHLGEIRSAAERSVLLTRQLLAYSRKQVLQPEVIELNDVIAGVEDMLKRLIGAHLVYVSLLDSSAGRVNADPVQLQQVLMNLVLNARDAMPDGGRVVVRTGMHNSEAPADMGDFALPAGSYATLTVTDTGCGIAPEVMPRVFEPFFTTKPVGQGSGLGLSTVYGIVKQSDGFIHVRSTVGQGTSFTIYLPRTQAAAIVHPDARPRQSTSGGAATVLIAEDESVLRSLAAIVLRRSGFTVFEAEDGLDALRIAQENAFGIDVLITDLVMPRMGGQALADRMLVSCPDLKIVFMSGYAEEAVARRGHLAEGCIFLAKPFSPNILTHVVRDLLVVPAPTQTAI